MVMDNCEGVGGFEDYGLNDSLCRFNGRTMVEWAINDSKWDKVSTWNEMVRKYNGGENE